MPKTIRQGASGREVKTLQHALNNLPPFTSEPLVADGLFGPKTAAQVRAFQNAFRLVVDGVVGPKTWGELLVELDRVLPRFGVDCGNVDNLNLSQAKSIEQEFLQGRPAGPGPLLAPAFRPFFASGRRLGPSVRTGSAATATLEPPRTAFRLLDATQKAKARTVFGDSLDFSRIFISNKVGLQNRPFTIAIQDGAKVAQIMNCGTFTPDEPTLIHELAHCWQSQHHSDPFRFMVNAIDCQSAAAAANRDEVFHDANVLRHPEHAAHFPNSPCAFVIETGFAELAAEQMANALGRGEVELTAHVKSIAMNVVDPANVTALNLAEFADRRLRNVGL